MTSVADNVQVHVEGLAKFRRDVKRADKEIAKELQAGLKDVAVKVAAEASVLEAGRARTGKLAAGYRGAAAGNKGVVRNRVFYSRFIEFGFHPGGGSTFVEGRNPIGRAIERREDSIVDEVGEAIDQAARQLGWK